MENPETGSYVEKVTATVRRPILSESEMMTTIVGTVAADVLAGTDGDDVFVSYGTGSAQNWDVLSGGNGADVYDLRGLSSATAGYTKAYNFIIDDQGTDGAVDGIDNVGSLYQSASLGYQGWATAVRIGDDLFVDTPHRPHRFRKPSKPAVHIEIKDQYAGSEVEYIESGGVTYALVLGNLGTIGADIMAGSNFDDIFDGQDGNDWVFGNGGRDELNLGAGDDTGFGGTGNDRIHGGDGNDSIYGEEGNDRIKGGAGGDWIKAGTGNDRIKGGSGADYIWGEDGRDKISGGAGSDKLFGGAGHDWLSGGKDGDVYSFQPNWGHDVIVDRGDKASKFDADAIELGGFYGPSSGNLDEAIARLSFARVGSDMVLTADEGESSLTVKNMFHSKTHKFFIENLNFSAGYWTSVQFKFLDGAKTDIGDDRGYPGGYNGELNEVLFGTDGDDLIYGNSGANFIWTGDGQDTLIYKENDTSLLYGIGGGSSVDIVEDFDILHDILDFSEIQGTTMSRLIFGTQADGDATVTWLSGDYEVSNIYIELRGVDVADLSADMFVFV